MAARNPYQQWIAIFGVALRSAAAASSTAAIILLNAGSLAAEEAPQAGLWKLIAKLHLADGTAREQSRSACLTPTMLSNLAEIPSSACKQRVRRDGFALNAQIECRAPEGENKVEFEIQVSFDTPRHYSGTVRGTGSLNGRTIAASITLEGEWIAECGK